MKKAYATVQIDTQKTKSKSSSASSLSEDFENETVKQEKSIFDQKAVNTFTNAIIVES